MSHLHIDFNTMMRVTHLMDMFYKHKY